MRPHHERHWSLMRELPDLPDLLPPEPDDDAVPGVHDDPRDVDFTVSACDDVEALQALESYDAALLEQQQQSARAAQAWRDNEANAANERSFDDMTDYDLRTEHEGSLDQIIANIKAAALPSPSSDTPPASASTPPRSTGHVARGFEFAAGKLTLSRTAMALPGSPSLIVDGVCERDPDDLALAKHVLGDDVRLCADFNTGEWKMWVLTPDHLFVLACWPCTPIADSGKQELFDAPDAFLTWGAMAAVVAHFRLPFAAGEQHPNIALVGDGAMLQALDSAMAQERMMRVLGYGDMGIEVFEDALHAERRRRCCLHYEHADLAALIGPCPTLSLGTYVRPQRIVDILDPPELVSPELYMDGVIELCHVKLPCSRRGPTRAVPSRWAAPASRSSSARASCSRPTTRSGSSITSSRGTASCSSSTTVASRSASRTWTSPR